MPRNCSSTPFEGAARFSDVHGWMTSDQRAFMLERGLPPPPLTGPPPPGWTPMREVGTNFVQSLLDTPAEFRIGTHSTTLGQMLFEGHPIYRGSGFLDVNGIRIPYTEPPSYTRILPVIRAALNMPEGRLISVGNSTGAYTSAQTFFSTPLPGDLAGPRTPDVPSVPSDLEVQRVRRGTPGTGFGNVRLVLQDDSWVDYGTLPDEVPARPMTLERALEIRSRVVSTFREAIADVIDLPEDHPRRVLVRNTLFGALRQVNNRATFVAIYNGQTPAGQLLLAPDIDTFFEIISEDRFAGHNLQPLREQHRRAIELATSRNGPGLIPAENVNIDGTLRRIVGRIAVRQADGTFTIIGHEADGTCYRMQVNATTAPPGSTIIQTPTGPDRFSNWCTTNQTSLTRVLRGVGITGTVLILHKLYTDVYNLINDTETEHNARQAARWGLTPRTWARMQAVPHFRNLGGGPPPREIAIGPFLLELSRLLREPPRGILDNPIEELTLFRDDWISLRNFINGRNGLRYRDSVLLDYINTQIERGNIVERTIEAQRARVQARVEEAVGLLATRPIDAVDMMIHEGDVRRFIREHPQLMNDLFAAFSFDGDLQYLYCLGIGWEEFHPNYFQNSIALAIRNTSSFHAGSNTTAFTNEYLDNMRQSRFALAAMWLLTVKQGSLQHPTFPRDQEVRVTQDYELIARSLSAENLMELTIPPITYRNYVPNTRTLVINYRRNMAARVRVLESLDRSVPILPAPRPGPIPAVIEGSLHIPFTEEFLPTREILRALNVEVCCSTDCPDPGVPPDLPQEETLEELFEFVGFTPVDFPWEGDFPGDPTPPVSPEAPRRPLGMIILERVPDVLAPPITPGAMRIMERIPVPDVPPVDPSTECVDAPAILEGVTNGPYSLESGSHFFKILAAPGSFNIQITATAVDGQSNIGVFGDSCETPSPIAIIGDLIQMGDNSYNPSWIPTDPPTVWIQITIGTSSLVEYSLTWSE